MVFIWKSCQHYFQKIGDAFEACGYERELGRVTVSNRPDLCEYQCNGAMAGAKKYHKAPFMIADEVAEKLQSSKVVKDVASVKPGFLNFNLDNEYLASCCQMKPSKHGCDSAPEKIYDDLRRTKCSKAASCWPSAFCNYRRERKENPSLCRK